LAAGTGREGGAPSHFRMDRSTSKRWSSSSQSTRTWCGLQRGGTRDGRVEMVVLLPIAESPAPIGPYGGADHGRPSASRTGENHWGAGTRKRGSRRAPFSSC